jgi:hypothetical protein
MADPDSRINKPNATIVDMGAGHGQMRGYGASSLGDINSKPEGTHFNTKLGVTVPNAFTSNF